MGKLGQGGGLSGSWRRKKRDKSSGGGISTKQLDKVMKGKKVAAAVQAKAEAVQKYWQGISPVFDAADPREHRKAPAHGAPGAYRDSIIIEDTSDDEGPSRRIKATDFKAKWIEYGSSHMPKYAPMAKTKAKFSK